MFLKSLTKTGLLTACAAVVGSIASSDGAQSRWYRALDKPAIQPPAVAFPVVWTSLYLDIALTSAGVLSARPRGSEVDGRARRRGATERHGTRRGGAAERGRRRRRTDPRKGYLTALTTNLVLNAGWSWVFFRQHRLLPALGVALALALSSFDLARRAGRVRGGYGWLLVPYALWCAFATVLTARVAALND